MGCSEGMLWLGRLGPVDKMIMDGYAQLCVGCQGQGVGAFFCFCFCFFHTSLSHPPPQLCGGVSAGGLSLLAFHSLRETALLAIYQHLTAAPGQEGDLQLKQCDSPPPPPLGLTQKRVGLLPPVAPFPLGGEVGLGRKGEGVGGRARALPFQMQPETKGN